MSFFLRDLIIKWRKDLGRTIDFLSTRDDIDMDKAKVRVMVSFFGRETPVELDFLQVEKA